MGFFKKADRAEGASQDEAVVSDVEIATDGNDEAALINYKTLTWWYVLIYRCLV
jgi:hypothetical protein